MLTTFDFENGASTELATNLEKQIERCETCGANQNKKNAELRQTQFKFIELFQKKKIIFLNFDLNTNLPPGKQRIFQSPEGRGLYLGTLGTTKANVKE